MAHSYTMHSGMAAGTTGETTMSTTRDSNGNILTKSVRKTAEGWQATVWFGGAYGFATDERTYTYRTREQARRADISDDIGQRGRIA